MIEFALATFLKANPAVAALVGVHVYAEKIPQGIKSAAIVYAKAPSERFYHSTGSSGLASSQITLTCHTNRGGVIDKAVEVYEAVRNAIDGFSGVMGTFDVRRCVISPYAYGSATPISGDEVGYPAVNASVSVIHRESVPVFS